MAKYGYIGNRPTQSSSSNTGIFNMTDVYKLIEAEKWVKQGFDISYLVVAGAGGGSTASSSDNRPGGGGGAGGYRNSYATETSGGNSTTETPFFALPGTNYTVTIGGGGAGGNGNYLREGAKGSDSTFATITSEGGGGCKVNFNADKNGGSGAGGKHNTNTGGTGISGQGHNGGNGSNSSGQSGGAGGGAGGVGGNNIHFQSGTISPGAGLSSSITGSAVTRALGGAQGKQGNTGTSGGANTGTGGRGTGGTSNAGSGGSGVVILRFPTADATITIGSGLTSSSTTDGSDTVVTFTAGTDSISFS